MKSSLEARLNELNNMREITCDEDMISALEDIIREEESRGIDEASVKVISEATVLLMSLKGFDTESVDAHADALLSQVANAAERNSRRKRTSPFYLPPVLKRVAVFALVILSTFTLTVTFNSHVRAAVTDTFVKWIKGLVILNFTTEETDAALSAYTVDAVSILSEPAKWSIPEGFTRITESLDGKSAFYHLENEVGDFIIAELVESDPSGVIHSTESHDYSEICLGDGVGYMFYNEVERTGSIIFGNSKVTVIVSGTADREALTETARGICK